MRTKRQKLTVILSAGGLLLALAIVLLFQGSDGTWFNRESDSDPGLSLEQELWNLDPNDPEAVATVFELRFARIRKETADATQAGFRLDGFSIAPLRTARSVLEQVCLPRVNYLKEKGQTIPSESLARAVPAHLLHGDPETICRDLVFEALVQARPALAGTDSKRLFDQLGQVDTLSARFLQSRRLEGPAAQANFDAYTTERQRLLSDAELDRVLFATQDDHTRLGFAYETFVTTEAARLPAAERIARYEALAGEFEKKHGIAARDQAPEQRDHLGRLLRLIELDRQPDEQLRASLIKQYAGDTAARVDQETRVADRAERETITAFEAERGSLFQAIADPPGSPAYRQRAAEIEEQLTRKYFMKK